MKTLENHIILFDGECPMCKVYTSAFVKTGMLDDDGRAAYQSKMDTVCPAIDRQRAVNEIALVDLKSGEVTYGVKSLFKIIGNSFPIFKPLLSFVPFEWVMGKVYAFISYNRRVIIPAGQSGDGYVYQPTFKKNYRIAYLLFTWLCTGFILTQYAHLLVGMVPLGSQYREYIICGAQIIFQGIIISTLATDELWNYLGNMMTISFAGSLLLLGPLAIGHWFMLSPLFFTACFMSVAGLMLWEHTRRTKLLKLGWKLTITWILYRLIVLAAILIVNI